MKKFIAVVGTIGSGKTTVSKFLAQEGYKKYKLTLPIYDEADKLGLDRESRVVLQDVGDRLRREDGNSVLADRVIEKIEGEIDKYPGFVIESIRNHNEVMALKERFGDEILVIAVDAPVRVRYKRAVKRKGQYKEQEMTYAEFERNDRRDLGNGNDENEQNVAKCMELADVKIVNDGTKSEFEEKVLDVIKTNN